MSARVPGGAAPGLAALVVASLVAGLIGSWSLHRRTTRYRAVVDATTTIAIDAYEISSSARSAAEGSPVATHVVEAGEARIDADLAQLDRLGWDERDLRWMRRLRGAVADTRGELGADGVDVDRRRFLLDLLRLNLRKLTTTAEIANATALERRAAAEAWLYRIGSASALAALVAVACALASSLRHHRARERHARDLAVANERLRAQTADMEELLYAASHDLKEPLRMVSSYIDLLQRAAADALPERARGHLGVVRVNARRMQMLIDDLLRLAILERGADGAETIDVAAAVAEVAARFRQRFADLGGALVVGPLPAVAVDRARFPQVIENLVGNALKYRDPARPPRVRIDGGDDRVGWRFAVVDNGLGVPPAHRDEIFKLFRRLHGAEIEGTGAGLAICRKIVEGWGGTIHVEDGDDGGSRFVFTVARAPAAAAGASRRGRR